MLALWPLDLSSMPRGVKNAVRLASSRMSVGSHPLVLRPLIFCLQLILMPNPNLDHCAPHRFETYDFEAMYTNLPDAALHKVMLGY